MQVGIWKIAYKKGKPRFFCVKTVKNAGNT